MEKGFIEQQAAKLVKSRRTSGISVLVVGLVFVAFAVFMYYTGDPEYAGIMLGIFGALGVIFCLTALFPLLKAAKIKRQAADYANLTVLSDNIDKKAAAKVINEEIAQGKTQLEIQPFKAYKDVKLILLPSYFLVSQHDITAVPVDKIYWVCVCHVDSNVYVNKQVVSVSGYVAGIFYDTRKYYINAKNKDAAKEIVARFHKFIPDVLGEYDDGLARLFDKDHAEFVRLYNQRKAEK